MMKTKYCTVKSFTLFSMVGVWVLIGISLFTNSIYAGGDEDSERIEPESEPYYAETADWEKCNFAFDRKIVKIFLSLDSMLSSPRKRTGIAGEPGLMMVIEDELILRTIEAGFEVAVREAVPENEEEYGRHGGGMVTVGNMRVVTSDGEFVVGITNVGFVYESESYIVQRVFYSWPIAKQLDDLVFLKNKIHLPQKTFEFLSGEDSVATAKKRYYSVREKFQNR